MRHYFFLIVFFFISGSFLSQCVVLTYQTDANQFGNVNENSATSQFEKIIELKENTTQITFTNTKNCGEDFDKMLFYNATNYYLNPGSESNYRLFLMDALTIAVDTLTMNANGTSDTLFVKVSNGFGSNLAIRKIKIVRKINLLEVPNQLAKEHFIIYPNPVNDILHLHFLKFDPDFVIQIFDLNGQELKDKGVDMVKTSDLGCAINVSSWSKGIYFVSCGGFMQKITVF